MKYDGIIFDLDGTLWDAVDNILISWNRVIEAKGIKPITKPALSACMGLEMTAIAARLFPDHSQEERNNLLWQCSDYELEYLTRHGGNIFPGIREIILQLFQTYPLFICSNCQKGYIECFLESSKLKEYFRDIECWGNTGRSKEENIRLIISRNGLKNPLYVGDTGKDEASAHGAGIDFCFAAYGFGEAQAPEHTISTPLELPSILLKG